MGWWGPQCVVPVAVESVPDDRQRRDLRVADLHAGVVGAGVECGVHA